MEPTNSGRVDHWCQCVDQQVHRDDQSLLPLLVHSFIACGRTRRPHAPACRRGLKKVVEKLKECGGKPLELNGGKGDQWISWTKPFVQGWTHTHTPVTHTHFHTCSPTCNHTIVRVATLSCCRHSHPCSKKCSQVSTNTSHHVQNTFTLSHSQLHRLHRLHTFTFHKFTFTLSQTSHYHIHNFITSQ